MGHGPSTAEAEVTNLDLDVALLKRADWSAWGRYFLDPDNWGLIVRRTLLMQWPYCREVSLRG
jgi:hypothetical protein